MKDIYSAESDWLWLCLIPGLYYKQRMVLLEYFKSPGRIRCASRGEFAMWESLGRDWVKKIYPALEPGWMTRLTAKMEEKQVRFLSRENSGFPERLKRLPDCPHGIFYKGTDLWNEGLRNLFVGIVGARRCTSYGAAMAEQISTVLAQSGVTIVSGMAYGVDGIAGRSALMAKGKSIAVLGNGPDICYPSANGDLYRELAVHGCVLSEFPPGTKPVPFHFPLRNRLISGLCDVLVVIEAGESSGSLITADLALDQGRDVYALPGRSTDTKSSGCNRLISQGAGIILSAQQLLDELMRQHPDCFSLAGGNRGKGRKQNPVLAPPDELVYSIVDSSPVTLEEIRIKSGLDIPSLMEILLRLQLEGLVTEIGKNHYIRK